MAQASAVRDDHFAVDADEERARGATHLPHLPKLLEEGDELDLGYGIEEGVHIVLVTGENRIEGGTVELGHDLIAGVLELADLGVGTVVDQVQALKNMFADEPTVSMDSGITLM